MNRVKVFLSGGPLHFPENQRVQLVDSVEAIIKFPFGAGYEHFRHSGEYMSLDGETLPVFLWRTRTCIAE
jgi:hypothetical protein